MRHAQLGGHDLARLAPGFFAAFGLLIACQNRDAAPPPSAAESTSGGTIVIATGVDVGGVNQLTGADSRFEQDIVDLLFLRLFEEQPDYAEHPPTFAPELAESHEWSEDGRVLTVRLRPGLEWSDGAPITAEDVAWTYTAQVDPDIAWRYAQSKDAIERVTAVGDRTVEFHFAEIYFSRLGDLNEGVVLPKHAWSGLPFSEWRGNEDWFIENLVVSGPFTVGRIVSQQEIVLERNPSYFRAGYPRVDRVVFRVIPNRTNRIEHLLTGEVDFVEHVLPERAPDVEASERASLTSLWHRQYTYLAWNGCREPFDDSRVRRAMTLAIDRESIVDALWGERARQAVSPILTSVWAFNDDLEPWPYDPAEASRLLAEAGWADHDRDGYLDRSGAKFSFDLSTNGDNRLRADAAVLIQEQLRQVGVDAQVALVEFNRLNDDNAAHDFDATIGAWGIDTSLDLTYAFHSDSIDNGYNYGCYSNAEVDKEIEVARRQREPLEAQTHLARVQQLIHEEQPYTFLWEPMRLYGLSSQLRDAEPNQLSAFFNLEEWWLAPSS
ncbi:MAG: ABC transporter substrate-binding protein [Thermoanaerobaculia bacterium]